MKFNLDLWRKNAFLGTHAVRIYFAGVYNSSDSHVTIGLIVLQNAAGTVCARSEWNVIVRKRNPPCCTALKSASRFMNASIVKSAREHKDKKKREDVAGTSYLSRMSLGVSRDALSVLFRHWRNYDRPFSHQETVTEFDRALKERFDYKNSG